MSRESAIEIGRLFPPIQAMADVLIASQNDLFVRLPGLEEYWPCGIRGASGVVGEHSRGVNALFQTGVCPTGYDGNSYAHLGDGTNFLYSVSAGAITGLETYIDTALRGLTIGAWVHPDASPAVWDGIVSKDGGVANRGYALAMSSVDLGNFIVSGNGAATVVAYSTAISTGDWHFMVGRFTPSTEVAVFVDGVKSVNVTAVPASINGSTQNFEVGRHYNDNARVFHGRVRDVFVCAAALSDALIEQIRLSSAP